MEYARSGRQMLGVFSEFEREMIRERVLAGMARARSQGKHLGRPRVDADTEGAVRATLAGGTGIVRTAKLGVGVGTVQRTAKGTQGAGLEPEAPSSHLRPRLRRDGCPRPSIGSRLEFLGDSP